MIENADKKLLSEEASNDGSIFSGVKSYHQAKLSTVYFFYVLYECVFINLIGFVTLLFQCQLQDLMQWFEGRFPSTPHFVIESLLGHYWLKDDLNCSTPQAQSLTYMIAGWLMVASILQAFINFDSLRFKFFPSEQSVTLPRGIKVTCMYCFFFCDWYWVVFMAFHHKNIGWHQIVGSVFDIFCRVPFAANPNLMFQKIQKKKKKKM